MCTGRQYGNFNIIVLVWCVFASISMCGVLRLSNSTVIFMCDGIVLVGVSSRAPSSVRRVRSWKGITDAILCCEILHVWCVATNSFRFRQAASRGRDFIGAVDGVLLIESEYSTRLAYLCYVILPSCFFADVNLLVSLQLSAILESGVGIYRTIHHHGFHRVLNCVLGFADVYSCDIELCPVCI